VFSSAESADEGDQSDFMSFGEEISTPSSKTHESYETYRIEAYPLGRGLTQDQMIREIEKKFDAPQYGGKARIVKDIKGLGGFTAEVIVVEVDKPEYRGYRWYYILMSAQTKRGVITYKIYNAQPAPGMYDNFDLFYRTFEVVPH